MASQEGGSAFGVGQLLCQGDGSNWATCLVIQPASLGWSCGISAEFREVLKASQRPGSLLSHSGFYHVLQVNARCKATSPGSLQNAPRSGQPSSCRCSNCSHCLRCPNLTHLSCRLLPQPSPLLEDASSSPWLEKGGNGKALFNVLIASSRAQSP